MATAYSSGGGGGGEYLTVTNSTGNLGWSTTNASVTTTGPVTISQTATSGTIMVGTTYNSTSGSITPITISSGGYVYADPTPADEIKSKPSPSENHEHDIQCRLRVESTKVISEYFCNHCETILFSKVISKIPKSIIKKQCLSRIVKGV